MITLNDSGDLTPNFTLPNTRLVFDGVKPAMPLPESVTFCGLLVALSLTAIKAGCAPEEFGLNAIPNTHELLGPTTTGSAPHDPVPLTVYSPSDGVTPETISGCAAPVFENVIVLVTVCPTTTFPNASDAVTDTDVVGTAVGVAVALAVAVAVAVEVAVAVAVGVAVAAAVAVAVAVRVAV